MLYSRDFQIVLDRKFISLIANIAMFYSRDLEGILDRKFISL